MEKSSFIRGRLCTYIFIRLFHGQNKVDQPSSLMKTVSSQEAVLVESFLGGAILRKISTFLQARKDEGMPCLVSSPTFSLKCEKRVPILVQDPTLISAVLVMCPSIAPQVNVCFFRRKLLSGELPPETRKCECHLVPGITRSVELGVRFAAQILWCNPQIVKSIATCSHGALCFVSPRPPHLEPC